MSVGKSSIARAASVKAAAPAKTDENTTAFMTVQTEKIESLTNTAIGDITKLLKSVKERGILVPVLLAATPDGKFWLIDGARRLEAAKKLNKKQLSAVVVSVQNKREAASLAKQLQSLTPKAKDIAPKAEDIHEEKFKAIEKTSSDMPYYLL